LDDFTVGGGEEVCGTKSDTNAGMVNDAPPADS
jgi:hypothetical protein